MPQGVAARGMGDAGLSRMWTGGLPRPVTVDYDYDALGNITIKDDYATDYQYGRQGRSNAAKAGPHAVLSIDKVGQRIVSDFCYDANGNVVAGDGRQITYTFFNKPETISEGAVTTRFSHDPHALPAGGTGQSHPLRRRSL